MKFGPLAALASIALTSPSLWAHHSAAAEYVAEMTSWHAVITRFAWTNPHTFVYFDAKDPGGKLLHYECEGSAPSGLIGNGWTRTTLQPGDKVTIEGWRAKDRPDGCKVRVVTLSDGRKLYMGWVESATETKGH
jgi:hypothetical protein